MPDEIRRTVVEAAEVNQKLVRVISFIQGGEDFEKINDCVRSDYRLCITSDCQYFFGQTKILRHHRKDARKRDGG
jgi:hypothetical protein